VKQRAAGVYGPEGSGAATVDADDVGELCAALAASPHGRARWCGHTDDDDALHTMLIVFGDAVTVQPAKHLDKSESMLVLNGDAEYFFFDDEGVMSARIHLTSFGPDAPFFCRVPRGRVHAVAVTSTTLIGHEVTSGPFQPTQTQVPSWAPPEGSAAAGMLFAELRARTAPKPTHDLGVVRHDDVDRLLADAQRTGRAELVVHGADDVVDERFVSSCGGRLEPQRGAADRSLVVVRGTATLIVYDDDDVPSSMLLSAFSAGGSFAARVPAGRWHVLIPGVGGVVLHAASRLQRSTDSNERPDVPRAIVDHMKLLESQA
jgi:cupin fold WbuC family metalloprotein